MHSLDLHSSCSGISVTAKLLGCPQDSAGWKVCWNVLFCRVPHTLMGGVGGAEVAKMKKTTLEVEETNN